jgi:hypothetical protein
VWLQISRVQRRLWRECRWLWRGADAGLSTTWFETHARQETANRGKIVTGSTDGSVSRMPGKTGGARFTGASDSLKVVSGASARGMADTQTAAANKIRTDIQRSRFTLMTPLKPEAITIVTDCQ